MCTINSERAVSKFHWLRNLRLPVGSFTFTFWGTLRWATIKTNRVQKHLLRTGNLWRVVALSTGGDNNKFPLPIRLTWHNSFENLKRYSIASNQPGNETTTDKEQAYTGDRPCGELWTFKPGRHKLQSTDGSAVAKRQRHLQIKLF